jgi:predicted transcriptional regulator
MSDKANMAVKLEPDLKAKLQALGETKKRSTHWLMCEAIRRYVETEEEAERHNREALESLARFEATGEYIAHEDVDAWLQTWGTDHELPAPTRTQVWPK